MMNTPNVTETCIISYKMRSLFAKQITANAGLLVVGPIMQCHYSVMAIFAFSHLEEHVKMKWIIYIQTRNTVG